MPKCTATEVPFSKLGRRQIDGRFDDGDVSSDGGLLLLRQVERRLGLLKAVAQVLLERLRTVGLAGTELARTQVWILPLAQ